MPFIVDDDPTFEWPVTIKKPTAEGVFKEESFTGVFRLVPSEEMTDVAQGRSEAEWLGEIVLTGWKGVDDVSGNPIPFTEGMRKKLLAIHYFNLAVINAYSTAVYRQELAVKNSATPRSAGH